MSGDRTFHPHEHLYPEMWGSQHMAYGHGNRLAQVHLPDGYQQAAGAVAVFDESGRPTYMTLSAYESARREYEHNRTETIIGYVATAAG